MSLARSDLALRLIDGFGVAEFERATGRPLEAVYGPELARLQEDGLLERVNGSARARAGSGEDSDERLRLTERGLLLADRVMAEFF